MKIRLALLFVVLIGIHVVLAEGPVNEFSATYDESVHLTAGSIYWKTGQFAFLGGDHPPFAQLWATIPLLFSKPFLPMQHPAWIAQSWKGTRAQYQLADAFLYHNRISVDSMLRSCRNMQVILSCLFGLSIMIVAAALGGAFSSAIAGVFWCFSPAILANGTLVSTDLAFSFFFFGFFASLLRFNSARANVLNGVFLGLAFASKYFAISILPILGALLIVDSRLRRSPKSWAVIFGVALLVLGLVYRFSDVAVFWDGFSRIFGRSQTGRSSFFLGRHGTDGWFAYFPFAFVVKTPLPLLVGLLFALLAVVRRKVSIPAVLWLPPALFFLMTCVSKVQIGHRYILAVYPFLFVIVALAVSHLDQKLKWAAVPVLAWYIVGTWMIRPNYLSYFNEAIGGPSRGYRYLTDSNVDWGQGLKQLSRSLTPDEMMKGIYLCYFGTADPHAYGIRYLDIGSDRIVERKDDSELALQPTTFAISVTHLQSTYYADKTVFDWLKQIEPSRKIAHSIFVYDFSNNPEALTRLQRLRQI